MEFRDYYQTLGVARGASAEEVKRAYRRLARKYHPDVSKEKDAGERMQEINEAYAVLSDPEKRAAYDKLGAGYQPGQEFRPPPDWDAGFEFSGRGFSPEEAAGFSDFFSEIFGRMAGARGAGGFTRSHAGEHHARILLDIEDSFTGATRQISLQTPGLDERGRLTLETRTLNVKIPKGIRAGQMIRLAGQGAAIRGERNPGDLLLEVGFRPHPRLHVDGRDLHLTVPVAPWEAALGAVVPIDLPGGTLNVRIPAGAEPGRQLRVRGKGLPCDPPGDLFLEIRIAAPPADTRKTRELYEALRAETAFDARKGWGTPP
ncbi:MAG: DnaJ C-terminal domain-containing protein [Pseudomonadota bacterium]